MTANHKARLVLLSLLALCLFNFPLIDIVDHHRSADGIPALYLYLFGVWVLIIVWTLLLNYRKDP